MALRRREKPGQEERPELGALQWYGAGTLSVVTSWGVTKKLMVAEMGRGHQEEEGLTTESSGHSRLLFLGNKPHLSLET